VVRFIDPAGPSRSYALNVSHLFDRRLLVSEGELRCAHPLDVGGAAHLAVSRLLVSTGP